VPIAFMLPRRLVTLMGRSHLSLYKILFHFKALLWESFHLLLPPPTCKPYPMAKLLHDHRAIYAPHTDPPPVYVIYHTILVMAISCEGQDAAELEASRSCMSNTRNEETNTVIYSYIPCFVNTFTLNMNVSMPYTGFD